MQAKGEDLITTARIPTCIRSTTCSRKTPWLGTFRAAISGRRAAHRNPSEQQQPNLLALSPWETFCPIRQTSQPLQESLYPSIRCGSSPPTSARILISIYTMRQFPRPAVTSDDVLDGDGITAYDCLIPLQSEQYIGSVTVSQNHLTKPAKIGHHPSSVLTYCSWNATRWNKKWRVSGHRLSRCL